MPSDHDHYSDDDLDSGSGGVRYDDFSADDAASDLAGDGLFGADVADEAPPRLSRGARLRAYADSFADDLLDELLPESLDWRGMVRSYPLTATAVALAGGFLLARQHGTFSDAHQLDELVAVLTAAADTYRRLLPAD